MAIVKLTYAERLVVAAATFNRLREQNINVESDRRGILTITALLEVLPIVLPVDRQIRVVRITDIPWLTPMLLELNAEHGDSTLRSVRPFVGPAVIGVGGISRDGLNELREHFPTIQIRSLQPNTSIVDSGCSYTHVYLAKGFVMKHVDGVVFGEFINTNLLIQTLKEIGI